MSAFEEQPVFVHIKLSRMNISKTMPERLPSSAVCALVMLFLLIMPAGASAQRIRRHRTERELEFHPPVSPAHGESTFKLEKPRWFYPRKDTVRLVFIGDIMMHKRQLEYDFGTFLEGIRSRLSGADLAVANMEFTLAGKPYSGYPAFSAPDGYAGYVADCGVDVFLTANNHILDKGMKGLERTLDVYDSMSDRVMVTGVSRDRSADSLSYPLIVAVKGIRVALVNFTYGTNAAQQSAWPKVNRIDHEDIEKAFERARERGADYIIALPHWGNEYELQHSAGQEKLAGELARLGADAIVGSHPHVVQDSTAIVTEDGRRVPVFYSVGNAVSNMSAPNTRLELAVSILIERDITGEVRMLEPEAEYLWCTLPGKLTDSFMTIAVDDWIGKRDCWKEPADYDNMMVTLERVQGKTGVGVSRLSRHQTP